MMDKIIVISCEFFSNRSLDRRDERRRVGKRRKKKDKNCKRTFQGRKKKRKIIQFRSIVSRGKETSKRASRESKIDRVEKMMFPLPSSGGDS